MNMRCRILPSFTISSARTVCYLKGVRGAGTATINGISCSGEARTGHISTSASSPPGPAKAKRRQH